ncbi:Hypothetical protein CINCED_3A005352 [Cinara cedri]|uniref:Uncharacterized protein n=1 Tax=Cinara cedri TaxID=506608 RepID=A0A5E4NPJ8_9HEMI|nr:Hypothetical protein CINCED_3A005352 [Cinara cedri]
MYGGPMEVHRRERSIDYMVKGRLRKRWKDSIKELIEETEVEWEQAYNSVMEGSNFSS